ncbi:sporulation membrane protein YtaF [Falsibacillus pallidus]|uniref:Putative sporulation protein YtaF n=1 Tax=Falsibacillus pallidus TaxID=493781 RepID=A0A370GKR1_9BACI|nr:sporulation membrane protein YtaF [Falsibacillus pallidus]RDI44237.1 putative sporulation protein YtaF [Falsibacillus pallidus]
MEFSLSLILLALAVSLDNFSTGLTYGLRKMHIPVKSIIIIACCSAASLLAAMLLGNLVESFLSPHIANQAGGFILVMLGAWVLFQFFRQDQQQEEEKTLINFEIRSLGVVIQILKKPTSADFDQSGTITGIEALMLGVALSLDAFGAGFGAAMLGYSPFILALTVAVMSLLFVTSGMKIGKIFSHVSWVQRMSFLPGILLILIGILKI